MKKEDNGTVNIESGEVSKIYHVHYPGFILYKEGNLEDDVKICSGVSYDRQIAGKLKGL